MPRPLPSAGRTSRPARAAAAANSPRTARALEPSSTSTTTTSTTARKRKGVPTKAPTRTEPSIVPASVPVLVKVLLKEQTRDVDNLRSKPALSPSSSPHGGAGENGTRAGNNKKKKGTPRDALPPVLEGYGRGKRAQSATLSGSGVTAGEQEHHSYARGKSPIHVHGRAGSPGVAAGPRRYTPYPPPAAAAAAGAYTHIMHDYTPHHHSPLSPPNQYRMGRSRSTGPASLGARSPPTVARAPSSSLPVYPTPSSSSSLPSTTVPSPATLLPPVAPSPYALGISASVTSPSPLARSFSATNVNANITVADAVAAAATATAETRSASVPRARTPSTTSTNGGAYRVAELSGTPIQ
ncbi:hypothetical protein JCM10908_006389 [Rhodotorula pacifica]|uniref:uncharacterized protein n=1 Tax=Rhodotorula pacifica TaxID=1495444 RepID=UPI0031766DCC